MGYLIKVQKVERPTNRSYYVNLPVVLAEAIELQKGDEWEWLIEDKNTLILSRAQKKEKRRLNSIRLRRIGVVQRSSGQFQSGGIKRIVLSERARLRREGQPPAPGRVNHPL